MRNAQTDKRLGLVGRAVIWIGLILTGASLYWIYETAHEFYSFPQNSRHSSNLDCPSLEIQSVISEYLVQSDHLEQAGRVMIRDNRASHKDGFPAPLTERIFDWNRAKFLAKPKNISAMAGYFCNHPTVTVNNKRVSGIPSIASEITQKSINKLEVDDLQLITCAVVASPGGVRQYISSSQKYFSNRELLIRQCEISFGGSVRP